MSEFETRPEEERVWDAPVDGRPPTAQEPAPPVRPPLTQEPFGPPPRTGRRNPIERLFPNMPHPWRVAIDWVVTILGAVAIVLAIKAWVVNPYRIPSSSMEPTLHCARPQPGCEAGSSDRVLANRFIYHFRKPDRGEIVVFETPPLAQKLCGAGGTFVKRPIGLPGERWEERNGQIYIDGRRLREPYVKPDRRDFQTHRLRDLPNGRGGQLGVDRIPSGMYLMIGDNRSSSCDSRVWGLVPRGNVIGRVLATYWPPRRMSLH